MAFSSLFTLLDDIASVLDDVALMTKAAAKKTVGVVGDDLALNADQVTGARADRELPIVWAVAKGSLFNKLILIPVALILAIFAPQLITPLLMIGGAYLCFEGVEKVLHRFLHHNDAQTHSQAIIEIDETSKIRGAVRTDFILSAEIIIIALGELQHTTLMVQIAALCVVGIGITAGVYGMVAIIVKADDFGAYLLRQGGSILTITGNTLLWIMPRFMRVLGVIGTAAMFLVGGGIFVHNLTWLHQWLHATHATDGIIGQIANLVTGVTVGMILCAIVLPLSKLFVNHNR